MRALLDTHTLLWAVSGRREQLSPTVATIISDKSNTICVSAASAWEIATKVRLGKLPAAERLERNFFEVMEIAGYTLLPIDVASALRAVVPQFQSEARPCAQGVSSPITVIPSTGYWRHRP